LLLEQFGAGEYSTSLHDLVALGAIADLADLHGDTRYLVQSGLDQIRNTPRPTLSAMLRAAEIEQARFSEEHVSFALAPRLNAVGRLADANPMVNFLLSNDLEEISVMVSKIEDMNARRKILCDQVFNGALASLQRDRSLLEQPVLILDHPDWPAGVVGIVASRLVELFHRPVILLVSPPGNPMRGSARSVAGIDITAALVQNQKLLHSFGGHPMAAGMSLSPDNYAAFKRGMSRSVAQQASLCQTSNDLMIDSWVLLHHFHLSC
jgi:single-stranded-DNA-specific exonuclease